MMEPIGVDDVIDWTILKGWANGVTTGPIRANNVSLNNVGLQPLFFFSCLSIQLSILTSSSVTLIQMQEQANTAQKAVDVEPSGGKMAGGVSV